MPKKIAAFGELLWDLLPNRKVLGGAPANFIYRINSFGDNGTLLSKVGNDKAGREAREALKRLGVSDENIQTDYEFPTGSVKVKIDNFGNADYNIITDVAYDHIEINAEMIDAFSQASCVCFGTLVQRYGISKNTLRELIHESPDVVKFLDINLRNNCYTAASIEESLKMANILKTNDEELLITKNLLNLKHENLKELAQETIEKYNLEIILCTLGSNGAFCLTNDDVFYYDSGYQISLGDTVGSGDAFSAGFVHYYMNDRPIEEALSFGNAAGAMVATTTGATSPISKEEILDFMVIPHNRNSVRFHQ
ncbi:fructokinase [Aquipluma nitroreducens]|uniref:Fructokinase n=1 Tax=Aquipluma nitroreducens TaxID=2010828 RepID=A0A5K7SCZ2_9BACT|nr:carbohydrate kinase [Aquipluma nitroreducens]BBE19327.1 fructokinase [Aquipluma nitroreducens]